MNPPVLALAGYLGVAFASLTTVPVAEVAAEILGAVDPDVIVIVVIASGVGRFRPGCVWVNQNKKSIAFARVRRGYWLE